jgi:hypothetical protein
MSATYTIEQLSGGVPTHRRRSSIGLAIVAGIAGFISILAGLYTVFPKTFSHAMEALIGCLFCSS